MNTEVLHRGRRMFAYYDGVLFVGQPQDERSHAEWFKEIHLDIAKASRGYVKAGWLCIYVGEDFSVPANWKEVLARASFLAKDSPRVGLGKKIGLVGVEWEPLIVYPSVEAALRD